MMYKAYNLTRKEYVHGTFKQVSGWLAALTCNDLHSSSVGRWCGDRIVIQACQPLHGRHVYVTASADRQMDDVTARLALTPPTPPK